MGEVPGGPREALQGLSQPPPRYQEDPGGPSPQNGTRVSYKGEAVTEAVSRPL